MKAEMSVGIDVEGKTVKLNVMPWEFMYHPDPLKPVPGDEMRKMSAKISIPQAECLVEDLQNIIRCLK